MSSSPSQIACSSSTPRHQCPPPHASLSSAPTLTFVATVSPANPASRSVVVLTAPEVAAKLPRNLRCVVIDSNEYKSLSSVGGVASSLPVAVKQFDTAIILYSSGTTGRVKAVAVLHLNLIAVTRAHRNNRVIAEKESAEAGEEPLMLTVTLFIRVHDVAEHVTLLPVAPPVLVAMIKSEEARRCDLSSLLFIGIGSAPLGHEVTERFAAIFPNIELIQVPCNLHDHNQLTLAAPQIPF
eukprot:XP_020401870.1 4-coumarate--CoA ligase-like 5 [Zea mays]